MRFLIEYDRDKGEIVSLQRFSDIEHAEANRARLELELALNRDGIIREVVLLEAESERDLRRTHRRYFAGIAELTIAPDGRSEGS